MPQQTANEIIDNKLNNQINIVNNNINLFFTGYFKTSKVFDLQSLAKYFAIIDLWGNRQLHSHLLAHGGTKWISIVGT